MTNLKKALENLRRMMRSKEDFWVTGSGLVYVPKARINEVSQVIAEAHQREVDELLRLLPKYPQE